MADKLDTRVAGDAILAKHNEIIALINNGNYITEFTQNEIDTILDSDSTAKILAFNSDTEQLEFWFTKEGQKIRRVLG